MTRFWQKFACAASGIIVLCLNHSAPVWSAAFGSTIENGDFQQNSSGLPAAWHIEDKVRGLGSVSVEQIRGGHQVLTIQPNRKNAGSERIGVGQMLDAKPYRGQRITVSAELAARGGAHAVVGIHVLSEGGYVQLLQAANQGILQTHRGSLSVPVEADNLIVYAIAVGVSGTAYFDNIKFSLAEAPAKVSAGSSFSAAAAAIEVQLDTELRVIPESILGANIEWINDGQGLWSTRLNQLNPKTVALTRDLGVTLLRFPGGVFSDFYDWRLGTGSQAQRSASRHFPNGPKSYHRFGTDEALKFAKQTNSRLLITVNAGHGKAEDAAGWVEYVNRNKRGGVTWWEIGNELYLASDLSGAAMSAAEYGDKLLEFGKAMRAVDPSIKLGAIGGLNYGRYRFVKDADWNNTILQKAAGEIDFLAVHNAYAPVLVGSSPDTDAYDVYRAMLAAPINIAQNLQSLDRQLAAYDRDGRKISLAITEWGPLFHFDPASPWVDHVKTLGSSLFIGSTLHAFLRHPRVEVATLFKLTDIGFMGWIGNRGNQFEPTAPYLAFQLYNNLAGGTVVESKAEVENYDSDAIGVVDAVRNVPYLDVLSVTKDNQVILYVVNKHFSKAFDTRIRFNGQVKFSALETTVLTGTAIDAHTGTRPPEIAGVKWAKQVELSRFSQGGEREITLSHASRAANLERNAGDSVLSYRFEPKSITRLVLNN